MVTVPPAAVPTAVTATDSGDEEKDLTQLHPDLHSNVSNVSKPANVSKPDIF